MLMPRQLDMQAQMSYDVRYPWQDAYFRLPGVKYAESIQRASQSACVVEKKVACVPLEWKGNGLNLQLYGFRVSLSIRGSCCLAGRALIVSIVNLYSI